MYKKCGFVRVGNIVPKLKVADISYNLEELIKQIKIANEKGINIILTPELSLTGASCGDLFKQNILIEESEKYLKELLLVTKEIDSVIVVGAPIKYQNKLYNVAIVIKKGNILGIVPKSYVNKEKIFASGSNITNQEINLCNQKVPFSTNLLFQDKENTDICFGIELNEDLFSLYPPSTKHALNGATIILNPSCNQELIGQYINRQNYVKNQSARIVSAYCYVSSGMHESTTDFVFSGHAMIAENGKILIENNLFDMESNLIYKDIDVQKLKILRRKNMFYQNLEQEMPYQIIEIDINNNNNQLERTYKEYPFVPNNQEERDKRCQEIFNIQATGLAKRLLHINTNKTVIGISGGLDSTLAYLVILEAYQKLGISPKNIIGVTMPGFGTTNRTYENACNLVKKTNATLKEVSIRDACLQHFKDIDLKEEDRNVTYENSQARERTQILMDIANLEGALMIGTGDLSELALGWCTYNGDHMSMYSINGSIPKTLVRSLVEWKVKNTSLDLSLVLKDILDTPISPELLPPDKYGKIEQKTENHIGPYVLHDFFLYHFLHDGATPEKIYFLACHTFKGKFSDGEIKKWLFVFFKRFFSQQFKRSCLPDGPAVGSINFSPREGQKIPSDVSSNLWLTRIKKL